jgi:hypothetical protein
VLSSRDILPEGVSGVNRIGTLNNCLSVEFAGMDKDFLKYETVNRLGGFHAIV